MREIGREIQEREEKSLEKRRQWMGEGERDAGEIGRTDTGKKNRERRGDKWIRVLYCSKHYHRFVGCDSGYRRLFEL